MRPPMNRKIFNAFLMGMGIAMLLLFFIVKNLGGDSGNVSWRLSLTRFHLVHQFAMPYFSPAHCGGFHLAADAQDLIFTLYTLVASFVPNVDWAVKITNLLASLVLGTGIFVFLGYLGILNLTARIFTAILVVSSGYWVCHMAQGGHAWAHGFAYLPWVLICMEEILRLEIRFDRRYFIFFLSLTGLFFLLINSGYYWLQVAAPVILLRLMIELVLSGRERKIQAFKTGTILLAVFAALTLSFPRLAGVYEFQLKKFPRMGGEVNPFQIIGGQKWFDLTFRSYFDGSIISGNKTDKFMGDPWDYSNFIGLCALLPLVWGLWNCRPWVKSRLFICLALAAMYQLALTQGDPVLCTLRFFVPLFKQITWYARGSAIVLLFLAALIAIGYESLIKQSKKIPFYIIAVLMTANLIEIVYVQATQINFKMDPPLVDLMHDINPPPYPADKPWGQCLLGYVFGYDHENPAQLQAKLDPGASVYDEPRPGFYNMHDVRVLASAQADGGYYLKEKWPLWPRKDAKALQEFIHYKQVVALPLWLSIGNWVSLFLWFIFFLCWGMIWGMKRPRRI